MAQTTADSLSSPTSQCVSLNNSFGFGAKDLNTNGEVTILQNFLFTNNYLSVKSTGFYGLLTQSAVKRLQQDNSINNTGYVGPLTKSLIKKISCVSNQTSTTTIQIISPTNLEKVLTIGKSENISWTGPFSYYYIEILDVKGNGVGTIKNSSFSFGNKFNYDWRVGDVFVADDMGLINQKTLDPGDYKINVVSIKKEDNSDKYLLSNYIIGPISFVANTDVQPVSVIVPKSSAPVLPYYDTSGNSSLATSPSVENQEINISEQIKKICPVEAPVPEYTQICGILSTLPASSTIQDLVQIAGNACSSKHPPAICAGGR